MLRRFMVCLLAGLILAAGLCAQAQELKSGDRGEAVKALQTSLTALHYLEKGQADGIFGGKTQAALIAFQKANNLQQTGTADDATLALIASGRALAAPATLARGDEGEAVAALQRGLIFYGFLDGKPDGQFGPSTQQAVKALQGVLGALGLDQGPSGQANPALQALLADYALSAYLDAMALDPDSAAIARLQKRLIALNYLDDAADGHFGDYTGECVKTFQQNNGLPATGQADGATWALLFDPGVAAAAHPVPRDLNRGDQGKAVAAVREKLIQYGFLSGLTGNSFDGDMAAALGRMKEYLGEAGDWLGAGDVLTAQAQVRLLDQDIAPYRADVRAGTKGAQTYRVQRRLHSLYYLGYEQVDGQAGAKTQAAIQRFQAHVGLEVTGVADESTQRLLFDRDAPHDKTEYLLKIALKDQRVYAYRLDEGGEYCLVRTMVCSTGLGNSTPKGIYRKTGPQDRWHYFEKFFCWAQYTYIIDGDIMFHSVLYSGRSESTLRSSSVYNLGSKASHGCVRLAVDDAKWIFDNCPKTTIVVIDDSFAQ